MKITKERLKKPSVFVATIIISLLMIFLLSKASSNILRSLTLIGGFAILIITLLTSASTNIKRMIQLYQLQAILTASVALLNALSPTKIPLLTVIIIPVSLVYLIPLLLGRATLRDLHVPSQSEATPPPSRWKPVKSPQSNWLKHGRSRYSPLVTTAIDTILVVIAFLTAFQIKQSSGAQSRFDAIQQPIDTYSLAISFTLLLIGLFTMINKQDIIAQIIGLLVMDQGLYLAAIKIITIQSLSISVAFSLYIYILFTMFILAWLLPTLHSTSETIELDGQKELKG